MATANDEYVGFLPVKELSDYEGTLGKIKKDIEQLDKLNKKGSGLFSSKDLKGYERSMGMLSRHVGKMRQGYQQAAREAARYRKEMEAIQKAGGTVTGAQKIKMAILNNSARQWQQGLMGGQLSQGMAQRAQEKTERQRERRQKMAAPVKNEWDAVRSTVVPSSVFTWALEKYKAGIGILIEQQMARTQSAAMTGRGSVPGLERDAARMGYRPAEAHNTHQQTAAATGYADRRNTVSNLAMMRAYALDSGTLTQYQSTARHAGDTSAPDKFNKEMVSSLKKSPFPRAFLKEFLQQSTTLLGQMSQGREVVQASEATALLSKFSKIMGGTYAASPTKAGSLLGRLSQTAENPGGGEAGEAFMLRAFGYGSGKSYVEALKAREAANPGQRAAAMTMQLKKEHGSMPRELQELALHRLSNRQVKLHESSRLLNMSNEQLQQLASNKSAPGTQEDVIKQGMQASNRLGAQKRQIARESQLADFAQANQKIADTFFKVESKIMGVATNLANALGTLAENATKASNAFAFLRNPFKGSSPQEPSKPTPAKSGRRK